MVDKCERVTGSFESIEVWPMFNPLVCCVAVGKLLSRDLGFPICKMELASPTSDGWWDDQMG